VSEAVAATTRSRAPRLASRFGAQADRARFQRYHRRGTRLLLFLLMTAIGASALFPLLFMLSASFRTQLDWANSRIGLPTTLSLAAFHRAYVGAKMGVYMRNSAIIATAAVLVCSTVGCTAGYAFSKLRWPFRRILYFFVLSWIAIPPVTLIVPIYVEMVRMHLYNTYAAEILLFAAITTPFNTYLMTAFYRSLPDDLVEAARMDGASTLGIFFRVMLPLGMPALATLIIFNALGVWNEFIYALLLLPSSAVKTLTVGVLQLQGQYFTDYPALMAGLLLTALPMICAYVFFQKYLIRAVVAGAVK
jgi:ABC-type glycerol-3-phosphate transport system permease component